MRILRERRQTFTGQPQKRLRERASDTMTFFKVDIEKKTLIMSAKEIAVDKPNCIIFHKLQGDQID